MQNSCKPLLPVGRFGALLSASLAIALLFLPRVLHAQGYSGINTILICNSGDTHLSVARVTNGGSHGFFGEDWVATGWYRVEPGDCEDFSEGASYHSWGTYYFGFRVNGRNLKVGVTGFGWGGYQSTDAAFCAKNPGRFSLKRSTRSALRDCPSGWELWPFSMRLVAGENGGYNKITINAEAGAPPAPPPGEEAPVVREIESDGGRAAFATGYAHSQAQEYAEARRSYLEAAEQGHNHARLNLGHLYYRGQGVAQDYAEAAKWYTEAAEQGHRASQFSLATLYYTGRGKEQNYKRAYAWYAVAAIQGQENAETWRDNAAAQLDASSLAGARMLAAMYRIAFVEQFR
ncbi:MAG: SEL1-like repeat protein [Gemmatimonadetes bacterium]|nr:SEL1-like repeat protein [Gemmatimonadota bacterium]